MTESEKKENNQSRGCPKSGRFWKDPKTRFKTLQKSPGFKKTFDEKQKFREEMKKIKELSRSLIKERDDAKAVKKERRRENLKRQQENARKAEIVQVVKNPAKIKRMKKKELKKIEKRDTLNMKS